MKALITTTVIYLAAITCCKASINENVLTYDKMYNTEINISVENINDGTSYKVTDSEGKVVQRGKLKSKDRISIPTKDLKSGTYTFEILGEKQKFIVK